MNVFRLSAILIFLLVFGSHVAYAGDEQAINEALRNQKEVTLQPGVYDLEDTIHVNEGNVLKGSPGTILRVPKNSRQWFVGMKGLITSNSGNIRIENLEIDGNCDELPRGFANSDPRYEHDAERGIIIAGSTGSFLKNITIRNVQIHDCFSDAVHVRFSENVQVDNVFASNCQHSSLYFVCVINGLIQNCEVAGITSDSVRIESSRDVKLLYSTLYGYFGPNSNGAYQGGHNLVQVGDQGHSKGAGSDKPIHTENIEIAHCTFSGKHLNTIWIDAAGKTPTTNLLIHDNQFVDMPEIERKGYSWENPPSVEEAEEIFTNIYDFLKQDYVFQYPTIQHDLRASATVKNVNESIKQSSTVRVSGKDLKVIKFEYNGITTKHFIERDMWVGELPHIGNDLYIPGKIQSEKLHITVYGEDGYQKVETIKMTEVSSAGVGINPNFFIFIAVLAICGLSIARNLRRIF